MGSWNGHQSSCTGFVSCRKRLRSSCQGVAAAQCSCKILSLVNIIGILYIIQISLYIFEIFVYGLVVAFSSLISLIIYVVGVMSSFFYVIQIRCFLGALSGHLCLPGLFCTIVFTISNFQSFLYFFYTSISIYLGFD